MTVLVNDRVVYAIREADGLAFSTEDPSPVPTTQRIYEFEPGCDADHVRFVAGDSVGYEDFVRAHASAQPEEAPKPKASKKSKD